MKGGNKINDNHAYAMVTSPGLSGSFSGFSGSGGLTGL